ncbi:IS66 family transposase [Aeromonas sp. EERV15]|uniref:IS66 family transposase n=1 Tax=Aeromonas sp. EERV15 TaxID=1833892 RepID=UPI00083A8753|nr:IS66 family transposase [Aeromonas sp. EERV15]
MTHRDLDREIRNDTLAEPICGCCGHELHACGVEESEQLKIIPAKISVLRHRQTKYAFRHCEHTAERTQVVTAPKPAQPIPQSIASPEALAAVDTAKYCDALPLYRQVDILARGGLELSRSTLASWCIKAGELVEPLRQAMRQHLLQQTVICADETVLQVLDEPDRPATSQSNMWVYRSGQYSDQPVVLYDYQPGRGKVYPAAFLQGYDGYLQCDGYRVYASLEGVSLSCCWAHARRKFKDALLAQPKKTGKTSHALSTTQKLYAIEQLARALSPEARCQLRQEKAGPLLMAFKVWLVESQAQLTPKSYVGEAINYVLNQWDALNRYLENGALGIDNNVTERDIRPFTTGRKNWLFATLVKGAKASATLYGLVMTCRANDINAYYYLQTLFRELPNRAEGAALDDLMPWNIKLDAEASPTV